MSSKLRIPKQHVKPLTEFVKLPALERRAFIAAIGKEKPTVNLAALGDRIAETSGLDSDKARRLLTLFVGLQIARETLDLSPHEFVVELRHEMEIHEGINLKASDAMVFEQSAETLLSAEGTLALTSKAGMVMREHRNLYHKGRVLTDLRPVFGTDVDEVPAALVAIHTLKVTYSHVSHAMGDIGEFFVALDRADVIKLIDVLGRALKKEDSLRHLVDKTSVTFLEVEP
jgi:hypothetical protein